MTTEMMSPLAWTAAWARMTGRVMQTQVDVMKVFLDAGARQQKIWMGLPVTETASAAVVKAPVAQARRKAPATRRKTPARRPATPRVPPENVQV